MSQSRPSYSQGGPSRLPMYVTHAPRSSTPSRKPAQTPRSSSASSRRHAFEDFDAPAYCQDMASYIAAQLALKPKNTKRDGQIQATETQDGWRGSDSRTALKPALNELADVSVQTELDEEAASKDSDDDSDEDEVNFERTQRKKEEARVFLEQLQSHPDHLTDAEKTLERDALDLFTGSQEASSGPDEKGLPAEVASQITGMLQDQPKGTSGPLIEEMENSNVDDSDSGEEDLEETSGGESSEEDDDNDDDEELDEEGHKIIEHGEEDMMSGEGSVVATEADPVEGQEDDGGSPEEEEDELQTFDDEANGQELYSDLMGDVLLPSGRHIYSDHNVERPSSYGETIELLDSSDEEAANVQETEGIFGRLEEQEAEQGGSGSEDEYEEQGTVEDPIDIQIEAAVSANLINASGFEDIPNVSAPSTNLFEQSSLPLEGFGGMPDALPVRAEPASDIPASELSDITSSFPNTLHEEAPAVHETNTLPATSTGADLVMLKEHINEDDEYVATPLSLDVLPGTPQRATSIDMRIGTPSHRLDHAEHNIPQPQLVEELDIETVTDVGIPIVETFDDVDAIQAFASDQDISVEDVKPLVGTADPAALIADEDGDGTQVPIIETIEEGDTTQFIEPDQEIVIEEVTAAVPTADAVGEEIDVAEEPISKTAEVVELPISEAVEEVKIRKSMAPEVEEAETLVASADRAAVGVNESDPLAESFDDHALGAHHADAQKGRSHFDKKHEGLKEVGRQANISTEGEVVELPEQAEEIGLEQFEEEAEKAADEAEGGNQELEHTAEEKAAQEENGVEHTPPVSPVITKKSLRRSTSRALSEGTSHGTPHKKRRHRRRSDASGDLADYIPSDEEEEEGAGRRPTKRAKGDDEKVVPQETAAETEENLLDVSILEEDETAMDMEEQNDRQSQDAQAAFVEPEMDDSPARRTRRQLRSRTSTAEHSDLDYSVDLHRSTSKRKRTPARSQRGSSQLADREETGDHVIAEEAEGTLADLDRDALVEKSGSMAMDVDVEIDLPETTRQTRRTPRKSAPRKSNDSSFRLTKVESDSDEAEKKEKEEKIKKRKESVKQRKAKEREAKKQEKEEEKKEEKEAEKAAAGLLRKKRVSEDAKNLRPQPEAELEEEEAVESGRIIRRRSQRRASQAPS